MKRFFVIFLTIYCSISSIKAQNVVKNRKLFLVETESRIFILENSKRKNFNTDISYGNGLHYYDTLFVEKLGHNDRTFWKIKIFNTRVFNADSFKKYYPSAKTILLPKQNSKTFVKLMDSTYHVTYDSMYNIYTVGRVFKVEYPTNFKRIASSSSVFYMSSILNSKFFDIKLFDNKTIIIGFIDGLLSEHKSKTNLNIDDTAYFWSVVVGSGQKR